MEKTVLCFIVTLVILSSRVEQSEGLFWRRSSRSPSSNLKPVDASCKRKGQVGDCQFYKCFEERRQCGSSGYLIGYGYKYCNKFAQKYYKFTRAGKEWIDCVKPCLTKNLIGKYEENVNPGSQCDSLKSYAFDTHVPCYIDCGFCNIYLSNKAALWSVYDLWDMMSRDAWKQMLAVGRQCLGK